MFLIASLSPIADPGSFSRHEVASSEVVTAAIRAKMLKFVSVLSVGVVLLGANVVLHIQDNELNNSIVKLDKELSEKKSDYTRLNAVLNAKFSPDNVKTYAENTGMVKRERYQIVYFDIADGNQIIVAE